MQIDLLNIYNLLFNRYGKQHWWPGETRDEIIIGAVLTQNTNWTNVEKAINNLKENTVCSLEGILKLDNSSLADMIRPAGYFNLKAQRLKDIALGIIDHDFSKMNTESFRDYLLSLKGIGPETADSILLYAFNRISFVIDAYTMRLANRIGFAWENIYYHELKDIFESNLPKEEYLYNEFHALIVKNAKITCKTKPDCIQCPLREYCALGREI